MTSKILVLLHSLFKILNPSYSIQNKSQKEAEIIQKKVFNQLIISAKNTKFGKDHKFNKIKTYQDFKKRVDIRDYEQKKVYIDRIKKERKMFYGKVNHYILQKHRVQLLVQNIFHYLKNLSRTKLTQLHIY